MTAATPAAFGVKVSLVTSPRPSFTRLWAVRQLPPPRTITPELLLSFAAIPCASIGSLASAHGAWNPLRDNRLVRVTVAGEELRLTYALFAGPAGGRVVAAAALTATQACTSDDDGHLNHGRRSVEKPRYSFLDIGNLNG